MEGATRPAGVHLQNKSSWNSFSRRSPLGSTGDNAGTTSGSATERSPPVRRFIHSERYVKTMPPTAPHPASSERAATVRDCEALQPNCLCLLHTGAPRAASVRAASHRMCRMCVCVCVCVVDVASIGQFRMRTTKRDEHSRWYEATRSPGRACATGSNCRSAEAPRDAPRAKHSCFSFRK